MPKPLAAGRFVRPFLGVECLEERRVLSAAVTFSLRDLLPAGTPLQARTVNLAPTASSLVQSLAHDVQQVTTAPLASVGHKHATGELSAVLTSTHSGESVQVQANSSTSVKSTSGYTRPLVLDASLSVSGPVGLNTTVRTTSQSSEPKSVSGPQDSLLSGSVAVTAQGPVSKPVSAAVTTIVSSASGGKKESNSSPKIPSTTVLAAVVPSTGSTGQNKDGQAAVTTTMETTVSQTSGASTSVQSSTGGPALDVASPLSSGDASSPAVASGGLLPSDSKSAGTQAAEQHVNPSSFAGAISVVSSAVQPLLAPGTAGSVIGTGSFSARAATVGGALAGQGVVVGAASAGISAPTPAGVEGTAQVLEIIPHAVPQSSGTAEGNEPTEEAVVATTVAQGASDIVKIGAADTAALDRALEQFLNQLDRAGDGVASALDQAQLSPWLVGMVLGGLALEFARRRWLRRLRVALPLTGAEHESTLSWLPGLGHLSNQEDS